MPCAAHAAAAPTHRAVPGRRGGACVRAVALSAVLLVAASAPAVGQADGPPAGGTRLDAVLSHETSRGAYGEPGTRTRIHQTTLTLRLRGRLHGRDASLEVQLPHLRVASRGAAAGLPDALQRGGSQTSGLGDVWWVGRWALRPADAPGPGLDLAVKFKTATGAVARGLGSGGRDLALQLEWLQPAWGGQLFGHLGKRHTGDLPGFRPYRNPWYGQLGWQTSPWPKVDLGAQWDAREPIGRLGPLLETTVYGALRQGDERWMLSLTRGWRDASPDLAMGLAWRHRF